MSPPSRTVLRGSFDGAEPGSLPRSASGNHIPGQIPTRGFNLRAWCLGNKLQQCLHACHKQTRNVDDFVSPLRTGARRRWPCTLASLLAMQSCRVRTSDRRPPAPRHGQPRHDIPSTDTTTPPLLHLDTRERRIRCELPMSKGAVSAWAAWKATAKICPSHRWWCSTQSGPERCHSARGAVLRRWSCAASAQSTCWGSALGSRAVSPPASLRCPDLGNATSCRLLLENLSFDYCCL